MLPEATAPRALTVKVELCVEPAEGEVKETVGLPLKILILRVAVALTLPEESIA